MATVRTYSISASTAAGAVRPDKLHAEIAASATVTNFSGVTVSGDVLDVVGASLANGAALDALVAAHTAFSITHSRAEKNAAIDARTQEIIAAGFTFDDHVFSLSVPAQINWSGLYSMQSFFTWPINVTTIDDQEYSLTLANLPYFIGTGSTAVANAIGHGRALKLAVGAATTQAGIDAVVDAR